MTDKIRNIMAQQADKQQKITNKIKTDADAKTKADAKAETDFSIVDIVEGINEKSILYYDIDLGSPFIIYNDQCEEFYDNINQIITSYTYNRYKSATKYKLDIKDILERQAKDRKIKTYIRTAFVDDCYYYKLHNDQIIKVASNGWKEVGLDKDIIFRPSDFSGDQVKPIKSDKNLFELFDNLLITKEEKILLIGVIVAANIDNINHPVLNITGDHGSGKSTISRYIKNIIDPNNGDQLSTIGTEKDLILELSNNICVAFDNLSNLKQSQSDIIAKAATGGGIKIRTLYKTAKMQSVVFNTTVIINSINDTFKQSDILDRTVKIELNRLNKFDNVNVFDNDEKIGKILYCVFDYLSQYLKNKEIGLYKDTKSPIRLSDYYNVTLTAAKCCGFSKVDVDKAFKHNKKKNVDQGLLKSVIGSWILENVDEDNSLCLTSSELFKLLNKESYKNPYSNPTSLGMNLNKIRVNLFDSGYFLSDKDTNTKKYTIIKY